jgi:hypothetical protein
MTDLLPKSWITRYWICGTKKTLSSRRSPPEVHRPLILTFANSVLKLWVRARSPGEAETEMRKRTQMTERMGTRTPRTAAPGLFPMLPAPPLLSLSCDDPSTQPGTPRWTHPLVSYWKQSPRVESARNFIPALSTPISLRPRRSVPLRSLTRSKSLAFHESRITTHELRFLIDALAIRICRNPMKTLVGAPI